MLIVPLQDEFGWRRATISAAVAINLVLYGLGGPFAAGLYDRFGIRRVIVIALASIAISSTLTTQMDAPWQLDLLWGVANGLATGAIGVTLAAVIANRWFVERRGLVTGMLTASNATGQLVFLPLLGWIVTSQGWRSAALTVSIVALAVHAPARRALPARQPGDVGLRAYGAVEDDPRDRAAEPVPGRDRRSRDARRARSTFWLLTGSFFVCGATTNGLIGTHLIPAAMDHGMSEVAAASLLAVIGVFDLVGTLCSGWLTDRYDPRWLLFWYYGLRGLSLLALPFVIGSTNLGLIAFVVFYGLDWVATVPPTVALTARRSEGSASASSSAGSSAPTSSAPRSQPGAPALPAPGSATTRAPSSPPGCSRSLASGPRDPDRGRRGRTRAGRAQPGRSPLHEAAALAAAAAVAARSRLAAAGARASAARRHRHRPPARGSTSAAAPSCAPVRRGRRSGRRRDLASPAPTAARCARARRRATAGP